MILFKLLALPVTAPVAGLRFCLDKVVEYAEQQLSDDAPVREQLLELQVALEEGTLTEEEYARREAELVARLREIREEQKERARASEASAPSHGEERTVVIEVPEELE